MAICGENSRRTKFVSRENKRIDTNWVDVVLCRIAWTIRDLGAFDVRDGHAPTLDVVDSLRPSDGVWVSPDRVCLICQEETGVELVGLNWRGDICSYTYTRNRMSILGSNHVWNRIGGDRNETV